MGVGGDTGWEEGRGWRGGGGAKVKARLSVATGPASEGTGVRHEGHRVWWAATGSWHAGQLRSGTGNVYPGSPARPTPALRTGWPTPSDALRDGAATARGGTVVPGDKGCTVGRWW